MAELSPRDRLNTKFQTFMDEQKITTRVGPFIDPRDEVFTIGSCFAQEIRASLRELGIVVTPRYSDLKFDPEEARADRLPREEHLNYYNAFTVLQEFERAVGLWKQDPNDYWELPFHRFWKGQIVYQDPYRRLILGKTLQAMQAVNAQLDVIIASAFRSAKAFLITYGMTEVWRNKSNGLVVTQKPLYGGGGGGGDQSYFWQTTFDDNLAVIRKTVRLLLEHKPGVKIFMTVSPVALERTFSENDIYVANTESKAILRAVLGQVAREFPEVTYFPAFEAVMSNGLQSFREGEGRHVRPEVVRPVVDAFVKAHVERQLVTA